MILVTGWLDAFALIGLCVGALRTLMRDFLELLIYLKRWRRG